MQLCKLFIIAILTIIVGCEGQGPPKRETPKSESQKNVEEKSAESVPRDKAPNKMKAKIKKRIQAVGPKLAVAEEKMEKARLHLEEAEYAVSAKAPEDATVATWNVWAQEEEYLPVSLLMPNTEYEIVVHMSSFSYDIYGIQSSIVSGGVHTILENARAEGKKSEKLKMYLTADPLFFDDPTQRYADLIIDLNKIDVIGQQYRTPHVMEDLKRSKGNTEYVLGEAVFKVRTRADVKGMGSLAVLVLKDMRPIDEITVNFCIQECKESVLTHHHGVNSIRALIESALPPEASLYFLALPNDDVYGIFCDNMLESEKAKSEELHCESWKVPYKKYEFESRIKEFSTVIDTIYEDDILANEGRWFFNVLSPVKKDGLFFQFLDRKISAFGKKAEKPALFIKVDTSSISSLIVPPIGLAVVQRSGVDYFVGDLFRVEVPLPMQSYARGDSCIAQWRAFFPLHDDITSCMTATALSTWKAWSYSPQTGAMYNIAALSDYLAQPDARVPEALVIISHQSSNRLYFEETEDGVSESAFILKKYATPSMAIVSGCNTAVPGSSDIVKRLNYNGMDSIVATNSTISEHMAGAFLSCLDEQYRRAGPKTYLFKLYDETIACLSKTMNNNGSEIGHLALKYMLLGNGYIEICKPH
jgi:hypothetical protein